MLRKPIMAGLALLGITGSLLLVFIGSMVVLSVTGSDMVRPWVLLLVFAIGSIAAWFALGRALPREYGARQFVVVAAAGVGPVLVWTIYQIAVFVTVGVEACAGGHIGGAVLGAMGAPGAPIMVVLGYLSRSRSNDSEEEG